MTWAEMLWCLVATRTLGLATRPDWIPFAVAQKTFVDPYTGRGSAQTHKY